MTTTLTDEDVLAFLDAEANDETRYEIDAVELTTEVRRIKTQQEAARKVAGMTYRGTRRVSWDDLESVSLSWLVEDVIGRDTVNFLVARPNSGKTFAVLDMVCSMALGRPWLGKRTEQVPVLIVLAEGLAGFYGRVVAWCEANDASVDDLKPWLHFVDGANLNNDESLRRIREIREEVGAQLVVIDTFAAASGSPNEDDNALGALMLASARDVAGGAALLFTHHPTKATEDSPAPVLRGAGALKGAADVVMTLYVDRHYSSSARDTREYLGLSTDHQHGGKNRNAQTETFRGLYLDAVGDSAAMFRDDSQQYSKGDRAVLDHLEDGMTSAEFSAAAGVSKSTAAEYLKSDLVRSEQDGRTWRYYLA